MHDDTVKRGFAALPEERRIEIASQGGKAAHEQGKAHQFTSEEAKAAGKKGGDRMAQNKEHMRRIGKIGGAKTSSDKEHMSRIGKKGGKAVSSNKDHMADIGRKGGAARGKKTTDE